MNSADKSNAFRKDVTQSHGANALSNAGQAAEDYSGHRGDAGTVFFVYRNEKI